MDHNSEKQSSIDRMREEMVSRYPLIWHRLITDWQSMGSANRAWLMFSANYLFCTRGIRWAIDPLELRSRLPQAPAMNAASDLRHLDFVLLTHRHKDHLDLGLLRSLRHLPILWVVPETMFPLVIEEAGVPTRQILVPQLMHPIDLHGLRITAFDGLHWEAAPGHPHGRRGVPATGYFVELGGKRWLFPGDIRTYNPVNFPDLGPVDVLFAHLWLGRAAALLPHPPLLELFCGFCLALRPRRIILTHLEEWGRQASDFWDPVHARQVVSVLKEQAPFIPIEIAITGDEISLD